MEGNRLAAWSADREDLGPPMAFVLREKEGRGRIKRNFAIGSALRRQQCGVAADPHWVLAKVPNEMKWSMQYFTVGRSVPDNFTLSTLVARRSWWKFQISLIFDPKFDMPGSGRPGGPRPALPPGMRSKLKMTLGIQGQLVFWDKAMDLIYLRHAVSVSHKGYVTIHIRKLLLRTTFRWQMCHFPLFEYLSCV